MGSNLLCLISGQQGSRSWRDYIYPSHYVARIIKRPASTREEANTVKKDGEEGYSPWACAAGKK